MATIGEVSVYDLTVGQIVNMDEAIYLYTPDDLPLLTGVGSNGMSVISSGPLDQIEADWLDETRLPPRSALAASITAAETVITVTSGDRAKFSTGDVVKLVKANATEVARVTGYGTTTDTLTIARAHAGSAATFSTNDVIIGLGTALAEGGDPQDARAVDRSARSNVTQIFGPTAVEMTGTARVVPRYGVQDEWAHQLAARQFESLQAREQALLYGRKTNSSVTKIRTMGGFDEYITTVVNTTTTEFTVTHLQTNMQSNYLLGGVPDIVTANPISLGTINDVNNTDRVRVEIDDPRRGRMRVLVVMTEFGDVTICRNRYCSPLHYFAWRRSQAKRRILRPDQFTMLAKTGDSDKGQFLCEETLQFKGEKHAHRATNMTAYTQA